jgi:hypothetical protein
VCRFAFASSFALSFLLTISLSISPSDTIAAILKLYLRRLPEPLFRWSLAERVAFTKDRDEHIRNGFLVLRAKLKRLPPIHVATLKGELATEVEERKAKN